MTILLYIAAFPGLFLVAGSIWYRAGLRYAAFLLDRGAYEEPTLGRALERGPFSSFQAMLRDRAHADAMTRRGDFGPEGRQLLLAERRAFNAVGLSLPIGIVAVYVMSRILPRAEIDASSGAKIAAAVLVIGAAAGLALITRSMRRAARSRQRRILIAYLASAVVLVIFVTFAVVNLLQIA